MLDRRQTEHAELGRLVPGDHVDSPAALADPIERRPELGELKGMPAIKDMDGGDEEDVAGDGAQSGRYHQRIHGFIPELGDTAIAAFPQPLGESECQVETQPIGAGSALRVVRELPVGSASQGACIPATVL